MTLRSFILPPINEISFSHEQRKLYPIRELSSCDDFSCTSPSQPQLLLNHQEQKATLILLSICQPESNKSPGGQFSLEENAAMVDFACCSWIKSSSGCCTKKVLEKPNKKLYASFVQDGAEDDAEKEDCSLLSDDFTDPSDVGRFAFPTISPKPFVLYHEEDEGNINEAHSFLRRSVLEGFLSKTSIPDGQGKTFFRMGFCCRFCKNKQHRAVQSIIFPESLQGIYRAVLRFQKFHLHKCIHIPDRIRDEAERARKGGRGNKSYWVKSAEDKGLYDIPGGKGIALCPAILAEITQV
ncbi:hypothetical protein ACHAXS_005198 [Conticribra weissflogii]